MNLVDFSKAQGAPRLGLFPFYKNNSPFAEGADGLRPLWGMTMKAAGSMRFRWNETNPNRDRFLSELCGEIDKLNDCIESLSDVLNHKPADDAPEKAAAYMRTKVLPAMSALRASADHLERITDRNCWPFPTYDELLFSI